MHSSRMHTDHKLRELTKVKIQTAQMDQVKRVKYMSEYSKLNMSKTTPLVIRKTGRVSQDKQTSKVL